MVPGMPDSLPDALTARLVRLLPRRALYWATVRAHSAATTGRWSNTDCPADAGTILRHLADGTRIGGAQPPLRWRAAHAAARLVPASVLAAGRHRQVVAALADDTLVVCATCDGAGILDARQPGPPEAPDAALVARELHATTDASVWARRFVAMHGGDEGLLLGWFANAIETGREAGRTARR